MEEYEKELEHLLSLFISMTKPLPMELQNQVDRLKNAVYEYGESERSDAYYSGFYSWYEDDARDEGYAAGYEDARAEFSKDD